MVISLGIISYITSQSHLDSFKEPFSQLISVMLDSNGKLEVR